MRAPSFTRCRAATASGGSSSHRGSTRHGLPLLRMPPGPASRLISGGCGETGLPLGPPALPGPESTAGSEARRAMKRLAVVARPRKPGQLGRTGASGQA